MSDGIQLPEDVRRLVAGIGGVITPADVDVYRSVRDIEDKSYKVRTVVTAWEGQQREERRLRRGYATWLLIAVFAQMVVADMAFFLLGAGVISVDKWVADTFIIAVFGQIAAMATIVVKYLFPDTGAQIVKLIEKL